MPVRNPSLPPVFAVALWFAWACGGGDPGAQSPAQSGPDGIDGGVDDARTPTPDGAAPSGNGESGDAQGAPETEGIVDAGSFQVAQVKGLALWLDAAKGITFHGGNYVRNWADQSENHNDGISGEPHPVEE